MALCSGPTRGAPSRRDCALKSRSHAISDRSLRWRIPLSRATAAAGAMGYMNKQETANSYSVLPRLEAVFFAAAIVGIGGALCAGCGTYAATRDDWPEPTFFGGIRFDAMIIANPGTGHGKLASCISVTIGVIDLPFSLVGDVLMLPVNVGLLVTSPRENTSGKTAPPAGSMSADLLGRSRPGLSHGWTPIAQFILERALGPPPRGTRRSRQTAGPRLGTPARGARGNSLAQRAGSSRAHRRTGRPIPAPP